MLKLTQVQIETIRGLEVGGVLTPSAIVSEARKPESPLHGLFSWNTEEAAERYWLMQARRIIARVRVHIQTSTVQITAPAYVRDPEAIPKQQGYRRVDALRADEELAREALNGELKRVAESLNRAQRMAIALGLSTEIEHLLAGVASLRVIVDDSVAGDAISIQ
jgi:hypothetical protein